MGRDLEGFEPYLISANVRSRFSPAGLQVSEGIGQVGDLVLGEVLPVPGRPITVFDQPLTPHTVSVPTRVVAILCTRLSTTHVNAGIPEGGLGVFSGSEAHWISGESGMVGCLSFEANPDTPFGAETSVGFSCEGLLKDGEGRAVNVESLVVTPDSQMHREAGAFLAVDQVDAGLITTYSSPETFRERILRSFLYAQDHEPDLILAELGGT